MGNIKENWFMIYILLNSDSMLTVDYLPVADKAGIMASAGSLKLCNAELGE